MRGITLSVAGLAFAAAFATLTAGNDGTLRYPRRARRDPHNDR
jgi:hypothetical protein